MNIFKQYAELKNLQAQTDLQLEELMPQIKRALQDSKRGNKRTKYGLFSLRKISIYEFGAQCMEFVTQKRDQIKQLSQEIEEAEQKDIEAGVAKPCRSRVTVVYNVPKRN